MWHDGNFNGRIQDKNMLVGVACQDAGKQKIICDMPSLCQQLVLVLCFYQVMET